ncbi:hypothetical protein FRX31_024185 [Thalictrum thalictroides]|uniref:Uncharacterized protein n=1 Tax=Thalictrum thalictroides TaxID=46969 RepID=A0A7J6VM90_THATH|nr:hypothetical protein FRX31_024185 [Thalictrum thalictroides]
MYFIVIIVHQVVEKPTKLTIRRGTSDSGNVTNRRKGKDKAPGGFGILHVADGAIYVRLGPKRGRYIPPDINNDQGPSQTDASTPSSQTQTSQLVDDVLQETTLPRRSPRKGKQVEPTPTITPRSLGKGKQVDYEGKTPGAKKSHTMMKGGLFLG